MEKSKTKKLKIRSAIRSIIQKSAPQKPKRSIRFKSDPMTLGYLDLATEKTFKPQLVGIVLNESYTGCALILASDDKLKRDQEIRIKVGNLDPIKANVIWLKTLDENIYKIGIKFQD